MLAEEHLVAFIALVDGDFSPPALWRGWNHHLDPGGEAALAVGLLPARGRAVGLPARGCERHTAAGAGQGCAVVLAGGIVTLVVT